MLARRHKFDGNAYQRCIRFPACQGTIDPSVASDDSGTKRTRRPAVRFAARAILAIVGSIVVYLGATSAGQILAEAFSR
jgi:hypothetical protein